MDITVVGAGVIGLAIAAELASPERTVAILEKNPRHGQETSSRNSEVIHAGIYYTPGSLKARLCMRGKELLYGYCKKHNIPCKKCGKIIAALRPGQESYIEKLHRNAKNCGLEDVSLIGPGEIARFEPGLKALLGLYSPSTGILSADILMDSYLKRAESQGAILLTQTKLTALTFKNNLYEITTDSQEPFLSRIVINSAGLYADKVAELAGIDVQKSGYAQRFIKGEYFRVKTDKTIGRLLYPPPDELSLGLHLTPDIEGRIRIGPSAFPVDAVEYSVNPANKDAFLNAARLFVPDIQASDLDPDTAGVRPRLAAFKSENPDFIIEHEHAKGLPGLVNLIGMESPGLTSAPAIADYVAKLLEGTL